MKVIHHVVDFDAPAAKIWSALTEQQGLAGWWTTHVDAPAAATVGSRAEFFFDGGFGALMEVVKLDPGVELEWRCIAKHEPWADNTFRFQLAALDDGRTRLRFWQDYAVELSDDAYGTYNFNWGYYLNSLLLLCTTGTGTPHVPTE